MTEQIKSALRTLNKWKNCNCTVDADDCIHRICENCEFNYDNDNIEESIDTAIHSLQAWEEVLQELEELKQEFKNDKRIHEAICVNISIKRIKEHLAEIEE